MRALLITIGMKWSAVGWGFLISCILSTAIDQSYQWFGIRICNQLPDAVNINCIYAVEKEKREGLNILLISIWVISAIAISGIPNKTDE